MKLIDRYILAQLFKATLIGVVLFVVIWVSPEILFRIIRQVSNNEITSHQGLLLLMYTIPEIIGKAIPVGILFGALFSFNRMGGHSELTIFRGIGIGFKRLAMPVLIIGLIGASISFIANDRLIPYSTMKIREIKGAKKHGHFVYMDKDEFNRPKKIVIVGNYGGDKKASNLKVLNFSNSEKNNEYILKNLITANSAEFADGTWTMQNAIKYTTSTNGIYEKIDKFDRLSLSDDNKSQRMLDILEYSIKENEEMTTADLRFYLNILKREKMFEEFRFLLNQYYSRFAQATSCILFGLCGMVLGFTRPREKKFTGFTLSAFIVFLYFASIPFLNMLSQKAIAPALFTAWLPCFIIFALTAGIYIHKRM